MRQKMEDNSYPYKNTASAKQPWATFQHLGEIKIKIILNTRDEQYIKNSDNC